MLVVDSQVHIWKDTMLNERHWQIENHTKDDLLEEMNAAGVDAVLLHPPGLWEGGNALADEAAQAHPDKFAVLGYVDLEAPNREELVAHYKDTPGHIGLRYTFMAEHMKSWPTDGSLDWFWSAAEEAGLPVGLLAHWYLPAVGKIAEKHPDLKLLIDHFGVLPGAKDDEGFKNLPELLSLAKYPNIGVKVSGGPSNSTQMYPYRNIHDYIRQIVEAFGPERSFWGTDLSRMPCSYKQCVTMFTEEMPWLTGRDLELVMGRALCDWIGWDL